MIRVAAIAAFFVFFCSSLAMAQAGRLLTINLADDKVNITTGFNGARLALFGVKKQAGDIAIVVQGPPRRMVVRRKDQVMGMWMNRDSLNFRNVPVYYDFALSKSAQSLAPAALLAEHNIGLNAMDFDPVVGRTEKETLERFKEALVRNKQRQGHFPLEPKNIVFLDNNFFRANFYMPADVPTGEYLIKTFLFEEGRVLDISETRLRVAQVGFSARLYRFAHFHSFIYGFVAVLIALTAGGGAWWFLRRE